MSQREGGAGHDHGAALSQCTASSITTPSVCPLLCFVPVQVTPFVQCMSVTVSVFSLVLIALERHQLILHPTGWSPAAGHSYLAVGLTWLVACFISLPFLSFNILTNDPFQNISLPANPFRWDLGYRCFLASVQRCCFILNWSWAELWGHITDFLKAQSLFLFFGNVRYLSHSPKRLGLVLHLAKSSVALRWSGAELIRGIKSAAAQ